MTERDIAGSDSWLLTRTDSQDAAGPLSSTACSRSPLARQDPRPPRTDAWAHGMAYDQELAKRMWRLIGSDPDLTEKKMSGELAFLIRGNMAIAASSQGGAVVRVDPRQSLP